MLESEVDDEEADSDYYRGHYNQKGGALKLLPRRPCDLLRQLNVRLFAIVNELSHLFI